MPISINGNGGGAPPSTLAALVADLLDAYINNQLDTTGHEVDFRRAMERADPSRAVSQSLVDGYHERVAGAIQRGRFTSQDVVRTPAGGLRGHALDIVRSSIPAEAFLPFDDVPPVEIPEYPEDTRFTVSFTGLFCEVRAGDRPFFEENEPYVITDAIEVRNDVANQMTTVRHPVGTPTTYTDVNSGDLRAGPVAAVWSGTLQQLTDLSIVVTVMENDEGDPDHYREKVRVAVAAAVAIIGFVNPVAGAIAAAVAKFVEDLITGLLGSGDDLIGSSTDLVPVGLLPFYASREPHPKFARNGDTHDVEMSRAVEVGWHVESPLGPLGPGHYWVLVKVEADRDPVVDVPAGPIDRDGLIEQHRGLGTVVFR